MVCSLYPFASAMACLHDAGLNRVSSGIASTTERHRQPPPTDTMVAEMEVAFQNEIINFMFLRDANGNLDVMNCLQLWFGKFNDTDIEIRERFGSHVATALRGKLDHWRNTPRGCLALMILIDQFPRNIYRHTIRMFAGDSVSKNMVYSSHYDWLKVLKPEECLFVPGLIMTHQENLADQEYGLRFYASLEPLLPASLSIFRTIFEEHHRIIKLCGTFPHRDHYYNRKTSAVGKSLMDNPTLRFDLPLCAGDDGKFYFGHDPVKLWLATQRAFDVVDRIDALINHGAQLRSPVSPNFIMTPKHSAEFAEIFRTFDKDGSGFLEVEELSAVLTSTGHHYSDFQLQEAVDQVTGRKGSTGLTFEQFANLIRVKLGSTLDTRLQQRFRMFNADDSGEISLEKFTACVQGLDGLVTTSEAAAMFKKCDLDASGSISMQDFMGIMKRRLSVGSNES
jgi:uncharacterized protein (DUF924 family)/Ca2+-binding EF-hand superfamily protein